ncbi:MAG: protein kinase [Pseudomonadota bacterium]
MSDNKLSAPKRADATKLIPQLFGRYLLLNHISDGGMGKIYLARLLSEQMAKIVAIKTIKNEMSADEHFRNMFLDEIKVTSALSHPNIARLWAVRVQPWEFAQKIPFNRVKDLSYNALIIDNAS